MIQTLDFLFEVWRNDELKKELLDNIDDIKKEKIIIGRHILTFLKEEKKVIVTHADSDHPQIIPAKLPTEKLKSMINNETDAWDLSDVIYLYDF